ncbi:MAG: family 78 glycoside hydrolase catalytic domain, partial [Thermoguttaceae bacterium]|nr:family 78 glycoside hydrolase catalytic domain [Thermoguttaceae bacterium]
SDAKLKDGEFRFVEVRDDVAVSIQTPENVDVMDAPLGKLVSQYIPPMRKTVEVKPIAVDNYAPGKWRVDFGQNLVGFAAMTVEGAPGAKVEIRFAETRLPDGSLYVDNLRTAKCRDIYTLRGDVGGETYEPRFTYHGFRFAEITAEGEIQLHSLTGWAVNTDAPVVGSFETSNATINQIYHNIVWGTRGNYLSMPTDCPQRDERMGWLGDRAEESKGEMYIFDASTIYSKVLQDVQESQLEDGNVSDVCPAYWRFYGTNVTWPSLQILVPRNLAMIYGDEKPIAKHYESRKAWLAHLMTFLEEDGTISKDNYGDWCVPPERADLIHSEDPARQTNRNLLATAYLINDVNIQAKYAEKLGRDEDAKFYRDFAEKTTKVFNEKFYDAEKGQ